MNFHQSPNPNWTHHHFGANIDPLMDFELSDYLVLEDGSVVDHQFDSLSSQSFPSPENNFLVGDGGGHGGSTDQAINNNNMSGATSSNTNIKSRKNKMDQVGHRVAFKTKSELEIMDDGFKWRKYGKKSVKNSPNPRNYYKCSSGGCNVKKRVERDREDSSYVITTYDGVHNHETPGVVYYNQMPLMAPNAWNLQPSHSHSHSHSHSSSSS
ncbi:probable WRKY transcription factor 51 [Humulus lupulus]|uniref:probable WRKY transcription factor 51 n=1 Tax=Humulus lupulus TaxID=3486 RepID=UPI002B407355|nr:probable WRKY transcription factor 51 [Humulus lupulus]